MNNGLEKPLLNLYSVPEFYVAQPIVGIVYFFPFLIFAIVSVVKLLPDKKGETGATESSPRRLTWILICLGSSALISFCVLTTYFWAGIRFTGDFVPAMILLSCIGFWQGYQWLEHNSSAIRFYIASSAVVATISIFLSTLLAISTNSKLVNLMIRVFPVLR